MAEKFANFAISSMLEDGEFVTLIRVDTDEYRKSLEMSE